ncbi:MAG TPA: hypothetical protein VMN78_01600 [Longimicrobiales bacterium]|nr:hypothetical protein [Longimicrobiales bacterium]
MNPLLPLLTAFAAGFSHALAPDHVAAVGTFVSRRPRPVDCLRFGTRWGFGHSASVMLAGGLILLLDVRVSERLAQNLERGVGAMLVGLGVWLLWCLAHERVHGRPSSDNEGGRRGSFLVGVAHGLAGTAPLIGLLPLAFIQPREAALAYLLLFSAGTVIAMALFAGAAGLVLSAAGRARPGLALTFRFGAALGSVVIGAVWFASV